jgi:predicted RNA binding protein YcfA (HicA-like mRNA interferase family)
VAKKYREVRRILRKAGWEHARTSGSHEIWVHPLRGSVALAAGGKENRDVPTRTLANLRRATGLEELR